MIKSISFKNFKVLRDATLPLGPLTLIVGPNGSGKTTALDAIRLVAQGWSHSYSSIRSTGKRVGDGNVRIDIEWAAPFNHVRTRAQINPMAGDQISVHVSNAQLVPSAPLANDQFDALWKPLLDFQSFSFDAAAIAQPVMLVPGAGLSENGANLAAVLDRLRDRYPERFEAVNEELGRWLPEFDRILFDTPQAGQRTMLLRTRIGGYPIRAANLSHGTRLALAVMTLAVSPEVPELVAIEEPEHGMHPRLLRDVVNALRRLASPQEYGLGSSARQVIITTHSPYVLDLFREDIDEIVIAEKGSEDARFSRLADRPDIDEILHDAHLGEAWYSGVLGGVPAVG